MLLSKTIISHICFFPKMWSSICYCILPSSSPRDQCWLQLTRDTYLCHAAEHIRQDCSSARTTRDLTVDLLSSWLPLPSLAQWRSYLFPIIMYSWHHLAFPRTERDKDGTKNLIDNAKYRERITVSTSRRNEVSFPSHSCYVSVFLVFAMYSISN